MLITLRDKLTSLNGMISMESTDKLEDKLGRIFTVVKTHHYKQAQKCSHLASEIQKASIDLSSAMRP